MSRNLFLHEDPASFPLDTLGDLLTDAVRGVELSRSDLAALPPHWRELVEDLAEAAEPCSENCGAWAPPKTARQVGPTAAASGEARGGVVVPVAVVTIEPEGAET